MAVVYFDSSAFVKLVVEEVGSDFAAALWDDCDAAVSSRLAYPEVCAARAAAGRAQRLQPRELRRARQLWDGYWSATRAVELTVAVGAKAGSLASDHALRGADAVHLASLLAIGTGVLLAAWDKRLRAGASAVGVRLAPAALDTRSSSD